MNCVGRDIPGMRVPPLVCLCFPWGIPQLQSDWSLSCDHGLDYASERENKNNSKVPGNHMRRVVFPYKYHAAVLASRKVGN